MQLAGMARLMNPVCLPPTNLSFALPLSDAGAGAVSTAPTVALGSATPTFTRATAATTVNSAGTVVSVATGVARSMYDPTSLAYLGYLAEGARTNLCLQSEVFDNASWVKSGSTVSANAIVAPDGNTTADTILDTAANATHDVSQNITKAAASLDYSITVWGKYSSQTLYVEGANVGSTAGARATFNLQAGTVSATSTFGAGFTAGTAAITVYPNGWYKCELRLTTDTDTTLKVTFRGTSTSYLGTGVAMFYLWGAQVEAGSFASSYIPTTTIAVARNADVLTYVLASNGNPAAGTVYAELSTQWTTAPATSMAIIFSDANGRPLYVGGTSASTTISSFDGTTTCGKAGLTDMNTGVRKRVSSWGTGQSSGGDGAAVATAVFDGSMGVAGVIGIGTTGSSNDWFGTIKNPRIWNTQLADASLQALTA